MDFNIDYQAEMCALKVKHYLITTMGRLVTEANADEFYRALSYALREEIMINWAASTRQLRELKKKVVYYLSMEYMPGRLLTNNIVNTQSMDIVLAMMNKLNRPFSEIASREADPGLGNGGLGRLASCLLDSLATLHYPSQAYGLRYQYGIFEQQIWDGAQIEAPDCWLLSEYPWEFRRDLRKVSVKFAGRSKPSKNIHGDEIYSLEDFEEVWAVPYDIPVVGYSSNQDESVVTLRLWSTKESPRNFQLQRYNAGRLDQAAENTALTDVLYPSDWHDTGKRVRLKQEFLLVSASLQDIIRHYLSIHDNFRSFADKVRIQINDTHPALIIAELMHQLTKIYDLPWKTAFEITQACVSYTNHTVLSEALEQWDVSLMEYLLPRQTKIIERINLEFCNNVRSRYQSDEAKVRRMSIIEGGKVRMANLAIVGSHAVNGVAELHSEILKNEVFKDFYEMAPDKFYNVTNGVTQRRWLLLCNPDLANFITKRIGDGWITHFEEISKLAEFAQDTESHRELALIKKKNKERMIQYVRHFDKVRNKQGEIIGAPTLVDETSLFDVQVKRIHEYKRQLMNALHVLMLYHDILEGQNAGRVKRTVIFGGKAAASYDTAKNIIRLINCIARKVNRDPKVNTQLKVLFVENYNVTKAELIIPAADLSEQISTAGLEASGTGNMKFTINGALTIGTDDGANIEMRKAVTDRWWPFGFGLNAKEASEISRDNGYSPSEIISQNTKIRKAVEALRDRSLAENDQEHEAFSSLYRRLTEGEFGEHADKFLVIKDLESYYETQKRVDLLYLNQEEWFEYVIHNIAAMGLFTTDRAITDYAKKIWQVDPAPLDPNILEEVRQEYKEHDRCRIF